MKSKIDEYLTAQREMGPVDGGTMAGAQWTPSQMVALAGKQNSKNIAIADKLKLDAEFAPGEPKFPLVFAGVKFGRTEGQYPPATAPAARTVRAAIDNKIANYEAQITYAVSQIEAFRARKEKLAQVLDFDISDFEKLL